MYPLLQHPNCFVWDFWYHYDTEKKCFHLLFLNADPELVPENQHHFSARVGYGITKDFTEIDWIDDDVFHAEDGGWDNTSIWTGDVIQIRNGFLLFYTSRDKNVDDGLTQNIGLAFSEDLVHWERVKDFQLKPDERYYEPRTLEGDTTVHAWRDPFLFLNEGEAYMIVSAKSNRLPLGRKGAIALLHARNKSLTDWMAMPPVFAPGWYSECEVSQLYIHKSRFALVFSSWAQHDNRPEIGGEGGLHVVEKADSIENEFEEMSKTLLPEDSGLYACRVIPELNGDIVGFDIKQGGLRRVSAQTGFQSVNRDFSHMTM